MALNGLMLGECDVEIGGAFWTFKRVFFYRYNVGLFFGILGSHIAVVFFCFLAWMLVAYLLLKHTVVYCISIRLFHEIITGCKKRNSD